MGRGRPGEAVFPIALAEVDARWIYASFIVNPSFQSFQITDTRGFDDILDSCAAFVEGVNGFFVPETQAHMEGCAVVLQPVHGRSAPDEFPHKVALHARAAGVDAGDDHLEGQAVPAIDRRRGVRVGPRLEQDATDLRCVGGGAGSRFQPRRPRCSEAA